MKDVSSWVQTWSGRRVDLPDPLEGSIVIEDVAVALSKQCRFNGHTTAFYSVAEHCVRVMKAALSRMGQVWFTWWRVPPPEARFALAALLHDASEAYLGDVTFPVKLQLGPELKELTRRVDLALVRDLVPEPDRADVFAFMHGTEVKAHDLVLLATEKRDLMKVQRDDWNPLPLPLEERIVPWSPDEARARFHEAYSHLLWGLQFAEELIQK